MTGKARFDPDKILDSLIPRPKARHIWRLTLWALALVPFIALVLIAGAAAIALSVKVFFGILTGA